MKRFIAALMCMAFFAAPALAENAASVTIDLQFGSQTYTDTVEVRWNGESFEGPFGLEDSGYPSNNWQIRFVQQALRALGYYGEEREITGHLGGATQDAIKDFCKDHDLAQSDILDQWTYEAIINAYHGYIERNGGVGAYGLITRDKVNLRHEPSMSADTLFVAELPKGTVCRVNRRMTIGGEVWLHVSATIGKYTYQGYVRSDMLETISASGEGGGGSAGTPVFGTVYNVDWFTYKSDLNRIGLEAGQGKDDNIVLTDLTTGKSLHIYVQSTGNHADVEPLTAADTATLCDIFGVSYPSQISYKRRPMMLTIFHDGKTYQFVCSMYGEPHGMQDIADNGYNGQFCLHFMNSRTAGTNRVDEDHQTAIQRAIGMLTYQGVTVQTFTGI